LHTVSVGLVKKNFESKMKVTYLAGLQLFILVSRVIKKKNSD
jgi:hypothetical protein